MLESIFTKLLILSVQAGFLILATLLIRGLFKKIPRKYICLLWCMVALRLLIPVTIESPVSLVPTESAIQEVFTENAPDDYGMQRMEQMLQASTPGESVENKDVIQTYTYTAPVGKLEVIEDNGEITTSYVTLPEKKATDLRMLVIYLWIFGTGILLSYGVFTYIRVRWKVRDAVHLEENVWLSDRIDTPFLLGYIKPRIYMPFFVDESRREYIIAHELGHIRRGDHITKLIGYILLAVYWFQPLVWIAYVMFCKDVEMACDELVIGNLGEEKKKAYSQTLLLCSVDKHYLLANPLAFGEIDVKKRITNVLSYKKPGVIISIISVVVLLLAAVFFMTSGEEKLPGTVELTDYQKQYLEMLADGTHYAIVPIAGEEEPLLLTTDYDWEKPFVGSGENTVYMNYCMFGHVGKISANGTAYPVRADKEALYLMDENHLTVMTVADGVNPENGFPYFEWAAYAKGEPDYEKMLKKYEEISLVEFTYTVEKPQEFTGKLTEAQVEYIKTLKPESRLALIPLEGTSELLLLSTSGVYYDPAFHSADISFAAEYCIFGEVEGINTGGTAYPIRADYDGIYLESGHSITVLSYSEEMKKEAGVDCLEKRVYSETDAEYPEILERCSLASVVEFRVPMIYADAAGEVQENLAAEIEHLGKVETSDAEQQVLIEKMIKQMSLQHGEYEKRFWASRKSQEIRESFQQQYGMPVRTVIKNHTEEEYSSIAKAVFDEYNKMEALFSSSLPIAGEWELNERYAEVKSDIFPNAKAVEDYIRQFCAKELTEWHYHTLFGDGQEDAALKEVDGKLYTAMFDGIPVSYSEYDSISILQASADELVYTIWPSTPFFEERDDTYFVRTVWEEDRWVVEECAPVMTKGSHDHYPETVYQRIPMGDYEVVLQDYTTGEGGPLEVAIIRGEESETLKVLYQDWQRDPAKVRLAEVGEIFGYECFYVYDFGLVHTVVTDFYAMVDGEIQQVAGSWGDDPEKSTFIRDLNGDGQHELICNLTYSADGRQSVRIYKRDGDRILLNYDGAETIVGLDEEYVSYANSHYDAESGRIVVCGYKDDEHQDIPWEIDMSVLEFGAYTQGY